MPTLNDHMDELTEQFWAATSELDEDSSYYDAQHRLASIGVSTPPEMRKLIAQVGWPRMYLDSIEERLDVEGFRMADESEADSRLWEWWQANNMDEESGLGHIEALIHGRAYITVAAPDLDDRTADQSVPVFRVESPHHMWAEIDPRTREVTRALRLYRSPNALNADGATLFLPDQTVLLQRPEGSLGKWVSTHTIEHNLGTVPVVPILNRARLSERVGRSEIIPELRSVTDAAARTLMNMQAAAELMAVPQRLLFGVAQEALAGNPDSPSSVLEAYYARIIGIEDPDAHATQFTAAELRNFTDVLSELSKQAASYTGLPPQYLSFSSENPASAEAIRSSESRLVKKCERKSRMFSGPWEDMIRLGMLVMDGEVPAEAQRIETLWRDPATPTYAAKADAVRKLYGDGPIIPLERARVDMGYSAEERAEMRQWDKDNPLAQLNALYGGSPVQNVEDSADDEALLDDELAA